MIFFYFISFLNIFVFILTRFLIKRNIIIFKLAYLTIGLQILVILISIFRQRSFVSFEITFFFIAMTITLIFLVPILIDKVLTEKKKGELLEIEENFKSFLLNSYDNFLEDKPKIQTFCENFSIYLTKIAISLIFSNKHFWFILGPWVIWVNLFIFETLITKNFIFSPYFFIYYFAIYRIFVVAIYIVKNHMDYLFREPLRNKLHFYLPVEMLNLFTLTNLVLNEKINSKEEKIASWKVFNIFLHFWIDSTIVTNFFYIDLTKLKKALDALSFFLIFFISFTLIFSISHKFCFIFFFLILASLSYFNRFFSFDLDPSVELFENIFKDLREYIGHFKFVLINEHEFTLKEVDENFQKPIRLEKPISFKKFFVPFVVAELCFFSFFAIFFDFFDSSFYFFQQVLFFISFEPFMFDLRFFYVISFIFSMIDFLFFLIFY